MSDAPMNLQPSRESRYERLLGYLQTFRDCEISYDDEMWAEANALVRELAKEHGDLASQVQIMAEITTLRSEVKQLKQDVGSLMLFHGTF